MPERCIDLPLVSDPGTKWEYGISIDWIGKAVEAVSGQKLGRYMQDNLLAPLGMTEPGSRSAVLSASGWPRYTPARQMVWSRRTRKFRKTPEFEMGGGGLYATVGDYLKFRADDHARRHL